MDLGLDGKTALITGSTRGIGRAIAERLLEEGASVVVSGRDVDRLEATERELGARFPGERVASYGGDLTRPEDVEALVAEAISRWGRVDIAVANIGSGRGVPLEASDREEWLRVFDTNLFCGMELVREIAPKMQAQGSGAICLVASITGVEAVGAPLPYTASKAGVIAAGKALARQLADSNVRVNTVCPGNVLFPGSDWDAKMTANSEQVLSYVEENVPMKRFGQPEEIAACAAFLVSECASFMTGACVVVDGGQTHAF